MKIEARQRKFEILGDTGCFLLAMIELGQDVLGHYIDALIVYIKALEVGFIKETSLILKHEQLMQQITGDEWQYHKEGPEYKLQFNEFEIQEWRRDDIGKSYTHFAYVRRSGEIVDTLGNSVTLAKGYLVSRRVFKLLPK